MTTLTHNKEAGDRDKDSKLKKLESKHTNKFKQMYGEAVSTAQQPATLQSQRKSQANMTKMERD